MTGSQSTVSHLVAAPDCPPPQAQLVWEAAYERFETPRQEIEKFTRRLRRIGAGGWPRNAGIVELFCGRGNGLHALSNLGFAHLEGVDLSPRLVAQYSGPARCYVGDCRELPFASSSKDVLIVQGGLHHLPQLPGDLDRTLAEARRVLKPEGMLMAVEPWLTPFLSLVHAIGRNPVARQLSNRVDALATMIQYERETYEQWLGQPDMILGGFAKHFVPRHLSMRFGKLLFLGCRRPME